MSMIESLVVAKTAATNPDSTKDERTSMIHPQQVPSPLASKMPPLYTLSWLFFFGVFLVVAFYFFLVASFYLNGLHRFTFDQIWFQNTPGSGDFPFSSRVYPFSVNATGFFLIFPAILVCGTARFFFPLYGIALMGLLGVRWRVLSRGARMLWVLLIVATVAATIIAYSLLGRSVTVWIAD